MTDFKVSVCIITYNHANYIEDTLRGIFMQEVPFRVEVIISEDCSPDDTQAVVEKLMADSPDNFEIKYFRHEKNLGPIYNLDWALKQCKGEYIAWCEGDDYWTDSSKLIKQVDILDRNPKYSMSTHNAWIKYEYIKKDDELFNEFGKFEKAIFNFEDVLNKWFIPSASMVVRRNVIDNLPDWFKTVYNGDWTLQLLASLSGEIHYLDDAMCVYRRNDKSLSFKVGYNMIFINKHKIYILSKLLESNSEFMALINNRIDELKTSNKKLSFSLKYLIKLNLIKWKRKIFN
ncbi:MAG: glycosyltransferase [Cryomorphaceae bacterium]|nr:glycosyltransferase [Cryomorphaceae bacterium]